MRETYLVLKDDGVVVRLLVARGQERVEVELLHPGTVSQAQPRQGEVRESPGGQQGLGGGLEGQQLVEGHLAGLEGGQDVLHCLDGRGGG